MIQSQLQNNMAKQHRPPVITIMGHVDHGKTTLLDFIRKSRVAAGEAGGITQHIGAYNIDHNGHPLTFIDTPGHAAFTKMRERGAHITDIVILVVAANDGVKPQTIESIRHIKHANVAVVVAINKSDLKDAQPDMAKSQLAEHDLLVQGFGGDIEVVELSAKTGKGVDKLLDTLVVLAELNDYSADSEASLEAVVIESFKDSRRGPVASVIVTQGTLKVRQEIMAGEVMGRVKLLSDASGKTLSEVIPGFPTEIIGFKTVPSVGSIVRDVTATYPEEKIEETEEAETAEVDPYADFDFGSLVDNKPKLKLIIRADVEGTLEAIVDTLDEESTQLLDFGVGQVSESDVELAAASGALIISFHSKVSKQVLAIAKNSKVRIKQYSVIYELIENLQKQMLKLMDPTIDEIVTGEAEILQIFEMRGERIAGVRVKTGEIKKTDQFYQKRGDVRLGEVFLKTMQHGKEIISSVKAKNEAGLTFQKKKLDFQVGDILVAYHLDDE